MASTYIAVEVADELPVYAPQVLQAEPACDKLLPGFFRDRYAAIIKSSVVTLIKKRVGSRRCSREHRFMHTLNKHCDHMVQASHPEYINMAHHHAEQETMLPGSKKNYNYCLSGQALQAGVVIISYLSSDSQKRIKSPTDCGFGSCCDISYVCQCDGDDT